MYVIKCKFKTDCPFLRYVVSNLAPYCNCWVWAYLEMMVSLYAPFDLSSYCTCIQLSNNLTDNMWVEYLKRYLHLLGHLGTNTLSTLSCVKVSWWTFPWRWLFCRSKLFVSNSNLRAMRKSIRDCAWRNKDHVCGLRKNNISIEIYRISRMN